MNYPNKIKQEICELICDKGASTTFIATKYNIPLKTIENWVTAYNKNPKHFKEQPKHLKLAQFSLDSVKKKDYKEMSSEELRLELMRRDVELMRLKKGYMVRKSGGRLEYGIFSD